MMTCDLSRCGNACGCRFEERGGIPLFSFTPAPHGGLDRMYFRFRLLHEGSGAPKRLIVQLRNFTTMLGVWRGTFLPVVRYGAEPFRRLEQGKILERGDSYRSLEWELTPPVGWDELEVAFSFPYDQEQLDRLLCETGGFWCEDEIGVSSEGRPFYRLSNSYGEATGGKKPGGLYLVARQHANETAGAWVLDGVLRRLAERRASFPVWCIPTADPDGVAAGNYGKNSFPRDMNRSWGPGEPMRHEVKNMVTDLTVWKERIDPASSLVFDFHGPWGDAEDVMLYCSSAQERCLVERKFAELEKRLGPMAMTPFLHDEERVLPASAWGSGWTLRKYAKEVPGIAAGVLEPSFYRAGGTVLEIADHQRIGALWADWAIDTVSR